MEIVVELFTLYQHILRPGLILCMLIATQPHAQAKFHYNSNAWEYIDLYYGPSPEFC